MSKGLYIPGDFGVFSPLPMYRGAVVYNIGEPVGIVAGTYTIHGKTTLLVVATAKYRRNNVQWGVMSTVSQVPLHSFNNQKALNNSPTGTGAGQFVNPAVTTETQMDNVVAYGSSGYMSSRVLTDLALSSGQQMAAFSWCRSLRSDYQSFDVPTIDVLMRLYKDAAAIDAFDPHVADFPQNALSKWGFGSSTDAGVWASNQFNATSAWALYGPGAYNGGVYAQNYKSNSFGVIPVMEIFV